MRSSCHNRSVEISVEPRNFRRTLDVYLLLFFSCKLPDFILSLLFKKKYSLVITLNEDDQLKKRVNKHTKFNKNFDIQY